MNPLSLLKMIPWGLCAILGLALGVQSWRLASEQAALAKEQLAFSNFREDLANKSLKVTQDAAAKSAEQVQKLTEAFSNLTTIASQTRTEIHYVQSNGGPCVADPKWRATVSGVRDIITGVRPSSNQSQTGGGSAQKVRGALVTRPGQKS